MSRLKYDIFYYPKERVSSGDTFRCRKCRTYLFSFDDLTSFHKKIEPVDQCSGWYLTCDVDGLDLPWVKTAIYESYWTEGKLYCPKCTSRIGAFNITQGVKCSCYAYVIPAVWIQKSKVDQVILSDMNPNIRLPRHNDKPGGHYNGNCDNSNLPNTWKMGRTGSQPDQSGLESSQGGTHDNQTESHSNQSRLQAGQTGSHTVATGLESSESGSQHLLAGLQYVKARSLTIQTRFRNIQSGSHDIQSKLHVIPCGSNNIEIESKQIQSSSLAQTGHAESQTGLSGLSQCNIQLTQTSKTGLTVLNHYDTKLGPSSLCTCNENSKANLLHRQEFSQECMVCHGFDVFHSLSNFQQVERAVLHNENSNLAQFSSCGCPAHSAIPACTLDTTERSTKDIQDRDNASSAYKRNIKQTVRDRRKQRKVKDDDFDRDEDMNTECDGDRLTRGRNGQNREKQESENIPEHLICPICLDLLYEPLFSPCDHVFCDSCLRILNSKCRKSVPRCPLCRKSLTYVYPAVDLRDEIRKAHPELYRNRHRVERRAPHRRLPLPSGRLKSRQKASDRLQEVPMPYSVLVFLVCVLAVCVLCLIILFVFCPPTSNHCVTVIGYE